eukprot:1611895-Pleurochrysis_carterae.AAC.1
MRECILPVCHKEASIWEERQPAGRRKFGLLKSVIAVPRATAVATQSRQRRRGQASQCMVSRIRDVDHCALDVGRYERAWAVEKARVQRAVSVAGRVGDAGDGLHSPSHPRFGGCAHNQSDHVVARVSHQDIAVCAHVHARWVVEARSLARAVSVAAPTAPCKATHSPAAHLEPFDLVVSSIAHEHGAVMRQSEAHRAHPSLARFDRLNHRGAADARREDATQPMVPCVCDEEALVGQDQHRARR